MRYEMKTHNWHSRLLSVLYFPDSAYLAAKWWHRLALVILWMWLILAVAGAVHALWDIWEGFEFARYLRDKGEYYDPYDRAAQELIEGAAYLLSVLVPVVVYRVLLFVGVGNAWKGEPAS
jgi:succinate dehydrogenase/fumarate reductase cytochrome b subunit